MLPSLLGNFISSTMSLFALLSSPGPAFVPQRDISDFSGKTVLITGGNTGIGYQTAKELLLKGASVYLAARTPSKGIQAIDQLEAETTRRAKFLELDLADLQSVRRAATKFLHQESTLDILFNNGQVRGVMEPPTHMLTAQGLDLQFGTNVVGHFFLTELLIPALNVSRSAPARIINLSSSGHRNAPPGTGIEFDSLNGGEQRDSWIAKWGNVAPTLLYGQSKLGNILISNHFAAKYDTLVSTALHPGGIRTELRRYGSGLMHIVKDKLLYPPSMGAITPLWAATTASPSEINGLYLVPWAQVASAGDADERTTDVELRNGLIAYLEKQIEGF
ncbi:Short-chain dehydrogenase/reductase family protein [Mycena sanguinolenta]|uniref:Short-chain dehydrogenase/reductase family protein n=1 Tax=Mycena sanguinolenta TaxID=230812 RepID=A0A8H6XYM7_9AGAR|nr:Short-chain dehydrogenase/reductase family protein [Mycena sanguinolenta]